MVTFPDELEEISIPTERTLTASTSSDYKAMLEILKAHSGEIVEAWAAAASRNAFVRGVEYSVPEMERLDRLNMFFSAMIERAIDMTDKKAHEVMKSAIRAEHARSLSLSAMVKKQNMLRDVMFSVIDREMPNISKASARLWLDAIIDRSVEGTVIMLEEYAEMQAALYHWMSGAQDTQTSLDQSLSRFCRSVLDYFEVDFASLFKHHPETNDLICQASSSRSLALTKDARIHLDSFPVAAEAIESRKTAIISNGKGKTGKKKKVLGQISFAHCISVPMMREEKVTGLFMLGDSSRTTMFTPDEVSIAEDLASQVVRVIESSEKFQALNLRSKAQRVLIETAASLQQEIESEEIYRIVASRLAELIPCNEFQFYAYDWEKRVGTPVYATGPYAAEIMADREFPADVGIAGYVAKSKRAEIVLDTEADPRGNYILGTPPARTRMLAVPVVGQKEVLGVIELLRYPPEIFTQEDLEIATMFANHASVALENARLLKEYSRVRDQIELSMDLMTHDIANYATPITAYLSTLRTKKDLDPEVVSMLDKTSSQLEGILQLVEMVRTMERLREIPPKVFKKMDLKKAIEHSMEYVRGRARKKEIDFETSLPEETMLVLADEMLDGLFTNLFYSAAMSDRMNRTKLFVSAEVRKDKKYEFWWVKVAQPSKSIPDHLKGEVLRMAKTSKSELTGGFGIGLAAARGIVSRYAGNMWVSDIVQGDYSKGCLFNILLPRTK